MTDDGVAEDGALLATGPALQPIYLHARFPDPGESFALCLLLPPGKKIVETTARNISRGVLMLFNLILGQDEE